MRTVAELPMPIGSVKVEVAIDRPDDEAVDDGIRVINYWVEKFFVDLEPYWNNTRTTNLDKAVKQLARIAPRWFHQARRAMSGRRVARVARCPVVSFVASVYERPRFGGRLLAQVDVLTGVYTIHPR